MRFPSFIVRQTSTRKLIAPSVGRAGSPATFRAPWMQQAQIAVRHNVQHEWNFPQRSLMDDLEGKVRCRLFPHAASLNVQDSPPVGVIWKQNVRKPRFTRLSANPPLLNENNAPHQSELLLQAPQPEFAEDTRVHYTRSCQGTAGGEQTHFWGVIAA